MFEGDYAINGSKGTAINRLRKNHKSQPQKYHKRKEYDLKLQMWLNVFIFLPFILKI